MKRRDCVIHLGETNVSVVQIFFPFFTKISSFHEAKQSARNIRAGSLPGPDA
jgi:hypothetical protein